MSALPWEQHKSVGNAAFAKGDYPASILSYSHAIECYEAPTQGAATEGDVNVHLQHIRDMSSASFSRYNEAALVDASAKLSSTVRTQLTAVLSNRAQTYMKLNQHEEALRDASIACVLDPENVKALYRKAVCLRSLGSLVDSARVATRILSLDKANAPAAELLRQIRQGLASGTAPSSAGGAASAPSSLSLADCLDLLHQYRRSRGEGQAPQHSSLEALVRALQIHLVAAGPVRAFLGQSEETGGLTALLAWCLSSGGPSLTPCLNVLLTLCARAGEQFLPVWGKEWAQERERGAGLQEFVGCTPSQVAIVHSCLSATRTQLIPRLVPGDWAGGAQAVSTVGALLRLSAALTGLAMQCVRLQVQDATAAQLKAGKDVKAGLVRSWVQLPEEWARTLREWAASASHILLHPPPASIESKADLPLLVAQSAGHILEQSGVEGTVRAYESAGLLDALAAHASPDCTIAGAEDRLGDEARAVRRGEIRKAAASALARALVICRDTAPRGYVAVGRDKLLALCRAILSAPLSPLAAALPNAPEEAKEGKDGGKTEQIADTPTPVGMPAWQPGPSHALITTMLHTTLLCDYEAGLELAGQAGVIPGLFIATGHASAAVQQAVTDTISLLAGSEPGRSLLTTLPQRVLSVDPATAQRLDPMAMLLRLSEAKDSKVRSGAAVTLTKLTASQGTFARDTASAGRSEVIRTALRELQASAGMEGGDEQEEEEVMEVYTASVSKTSAPVKQAKKAKAPLTFKSSLDMALQALTAGAGGKGNGASAPAVKLDMHRISRAMESAALISVHTSGKNELSRNPAALSSLVRAGASIVMHLYLQAALLSHGGQGEEGGVLRIGGRYGSSTVKASELPGDIRSGSSASELRPAALGLATILHNLVVSRQSLQEAKLQDMGVDRQQWEQLQKLTSPAGNEGQVLGASLPAVEHDPPSDVEARGRALVAADVVQLAVGLADAVRMLASSCAQAEGWTGLPGSAQKRPDGRPAPLPLIDTAKAGAAIRDSLSHFLCALAAWTWARGGMVQAGCIPALLDLASPDALGPGHVSKGSSAISDGNGVQATGATAGGHGSAALTNTEAGWQAAAQCLARVLISTNPALIPGGEQVLSDCVGPLLRLARESSAALAQFEAAMALTNLASAGEGIRESMVRRGAVGALEFLQFSSHHMVRRAGTEGLTNLACTARASRLMTGARATLWLALATCFEKGEGQAAGPAAPGTVQDDTPTALAAAGGFAMAVSAQCDELGGEGGGEEVTSQTQAEEIEQGCITRIVRAGAARVGAELLLAGQASPGLPHRAAVWLARLACYPLGCAALLTPLRYGGADVEEHARPKGQLADLTPYHLLLLVAQGQDLAALAAGQDGGLQAPHSGRGGGKRQGRADKGATTPVQRLAASAVRRILRCKWEAVAAAAQAEMAASSRKEEAGGAEGVEIGGDPRPGQEVLQPQQPDDKYAMQILLEAGVGHSSDTEVE